LQLESINPTKRNGMWVICLMFTSHLSFYCSVIG
jgi:hypothetical protein